MDYFGSILCPFHTVEFVSVGSFLMARTINIKARTHFEQYLSPKLLICTKSASKILVPPMAFELSISIGTFFD